ncbi:hypothetical protein ABW21_db0207258 [Orbilia brochopaga]|nr:hypothetical protein ABW21_db0207258 [Drechslerella brochopaga]
MATAFNASLKAWRNHQEMHHDGQSASSYPIFFTRDILDKILSHVPARDIMHSCRLVCKEWNQFIKLSRGQPVDTIAPQPHTRGTRGTRRPREVVQKPQLITPMALDVLAAFWKRLAEIGIDSNLMVTDKIDWGTPLPPRFRSGPSLTTEETLRTLFREHMWSERRLPEALPEQVNRQKLLRKIHELYEEFAEIVDATPFSDPDDRSARPIVEVVVKGVTNWAYIDRQAFENVGHQISEGLRPAASLKMPKSWADTLHMMAAAVYGYSPLGTIDFGDGDGMFESVTKWDGFGIVGSGPLCSLMFSGEGFGPWKRLTLGCREPFNIALEDRKYTRVAWKANGIHA